MEESIMSKRFTVDEGLEDVLCWEINDKENEDMTCGECAKLLNELHDEKQSVIDWIDNKIEEIKPYNSELCRATLLELKEFLE